MDSIHVRLRRHAHFRYRNGRPGLSNVQRALCPLRGPGPQRGALAVLRPANRGRARGKRFLPAGQIYVYTPFGPIIDTIKIPERPIQIVFGGPKGDTLFVCARTSLYAVKMRNPGR